MKGMTHPSPGWGHWGSFKELTGGRYRGVGEIDPEFLKNLDVVGLSWLTPLEVDDGALDWQSWRFQTSVAELYCSNSGGIIFVSQGNWEG